MRQLFIKTLALLCIASIPYITASSAEEPTPWYENEQDVPYPDNTQALQSATDNSVDILHHDIESKAQALQGEIMLRLRDDIAEVYSNGNLVEQIIKGVGSTGLITALESNRLRFTPTGRPELICPSEDATWFGPCRVEHTSLSNRE